MKCRSCGTELEESWSFCPRCGAKKGQEFGRGMEDIMELFERSFKGIFSGGFPSFPFGKGFMVEVSQEGGSPKVSVKEFSKPMEKREEVFEAKEIPKDSQIVEPKVSVKGAKNIINVELPGVKSEEDIYIKRFHDSIEIRAFSDNKVYFAILPNIKTQTVEHDFKSGMLTLKLS